MPYPISPSDRAIEIINAWCKYADGSRMHPHQAEFWTARDVLEGVLRVSPPRALQAVEFIRSKCKPSDDREILLAALEERGYK